MEKQKKIIILSIAIIFVIAAIIWNLDLKKNKNEIHEVNSNSNNEISTQENMRKSEEIPAKESENDVQGIQKPPAAASLNAALITANTKNSVGINTRFGYNLAADLLKDRGDFELRDMIFTKYFSEADKGKDLILFTFYLTNKNKEVQIKYYIKKNKAVIYLEYNLNNPKESVLASTLNKTLIPQTAIDFGFERAIAKIETNDDYLKIANKTSSFPWVSFHNSPYGWEFQTMVDAKGSASGNKEKYSFSVNLDKNQVFFERRS